jgi:hypothetical protein
LVGERIVATTKISEGQDKLDKLGGKTTGKTEAGQKVLEIYRTRVNQTKTAKPELPQPLPPQTDVVKPPIQTPTTTVVTDILEPLKNSMSSDELKLVRKIVFSLKKNCPVANRELIEKLITQIVKDLSK